MHDRVAEVLAERATLDSGAAAGLALSVALHAGVTAAIVYAALHHPAPELTNVLQIKFAPVTAPTVVAAPPPAAPPKAPPKAVPAAPVPPPAPAKPVEKPVVKNTAPPDAFGRSTKKPAEVPVPPATRPQPVPIAQPSHPATPAASGIPGVASATNIAPGTSGVTGIEGGDFPYTIYISVMNHLVSSHWFRPQAETPKAPATVHFIINRDGTLRDITLQSSSGNAVFDRAALRAVTESSPLGPLPFAYTNTYLGIYMTFQ